MIVHLFGDEKFVDVTIENFENISKAKNRYVVFSNKNELKYVTRKEDVVVLPNSAYRLDLDIIFDDCQLLVVHFLTPLKLFIIKNRPPHVKVLWSVWGGDAYDHLQNHNFFEPITENIRKKSLYQSLRFTLLYSWYHLLRYRVRPIGEEKSVLRKIAFVSTVLPNEFELIKKAFRLNAKYVDYNYGINKFSDLNECNLGSSVLIGNSATPSNNHLDVFNIIKETDKNLIVPLSYGAYDFKSYKERIILDGKKMFGECFKAVTSYLSIHDYNKLLFSCNTAIMFHIRQQALGNIFMTLFMGMRVFLNSKSLTYIFLKDEGLIVFDLKEDYKLIGIELSDYEKKINRDIVRKLRGKEAIKKKIQGIVDLYNSVK